MTPHLEACLIGGGRIGQVFLKELAGSCLDSRDRGKVLVQR
jgi:hypothetical protein